MTAARFVICLAVLFPVQALSQTAHSCWIENVRKEGSGVALLHNKVMDSPEESDVIDGLDAQTDTAEVSHDQLARI